MKKLKSLTKLFLIMIVCFISMGAQCQQRGKDKPAGPPSTKIKIKTSGDSDYSYPIGPPHPSPDGSPEEIPFKPLGPNGPIDVPNPCPPPREMISYFFAFEVSFPAGKDPQKPYHIHQSIKNTLITNKGRSDEKVEKIPPDQPAKPGPPFKPPIPGGFEGKNWETDVDSSGNPISPQNNSDGKSSYLDNPGVLVDVPNGLPLHKKTKFRWELHDDKHNILDCIEAEYELEILRNGRVIKNSMTKPVPCK